MKVQTFSATKGIADEELFDKSSRKRAKTDAIVRAAARLIYKKGVTDTSLDDVAEELGIAKPSLYYYVKNKEELLFLCNLRIFELRERAISKAVENGSNGAEKLEHFTRSLIAIVMDPESGMPRLWQGPNSILTGERRSTMNKVNETQSKAIQAMIKEGIKDGSLDINDPAMAETALVGGVYWIPMSEYFNGPVDIKELSDGYIHMYFDGLRSRAKKRGSSRR